MSNCCVCREEILKDPKLEKTEEPSSGYIFVDGKGMIPYEKNFVELQKKENRVDLLGPNGEIVTRFFCSECFSLHIEESYRNFQKTLSEF